MDKIRFKLKTQQTIQSLQAPVEKKGLPNVPELSLLFLRAKFSLVFDSNANTLHTHVQGPNRTVWGELRCAHPTSTNLLTVVTDQKIQPFRSSNQTKPNQMEWNGIPLNRPSTLIGLWLLSRTTKRRRGGKWHSKQSNKTLGVCLVRKTDTGETGNRDDHESTWRRTAPQPSKNLPTTK